MNQITKAVLRKTYRKRKKQYIQNGGHNNNHWKLRQNLLRIFHLCSQVNTVGSYINVHNKELIPPYLPQITYAYPLFSQYNKDMEFIIHDNSSQYERGPYNIKIPICRKKQDIVKDLDVVLVPLMCFTLQKDRVGYGGGYYDAFIGKNRKNKRKRTVFVGIGAQILKYEGETSGIFNKWDEKLDYVITEAKIY